VTIAE
jgi:voltage-dependent calcium channel L type alpha-1F